MWQQGRGSFAVCSAEWVKARKQVRRKLNDAGDTLQDQWKDAGAYLKDQASSLGDQAGKVYRKGKEAAASYSDDLVDSFQYAVKSVKG